MLGWRVTQAGWAGLAGRIVARVGAVHAQLLGLVGMALGCASLIRVGAAPSYGTDVLPGLVVLGLAAPLVFVSGSTLALQCVQPGDSGLASGILGSCQWLGGSLGVAAVSALLTTAGDDVVDGLRAGFGLCAAAAPRLRCSPDSRPGVGHLRVVSPLSRRSRGSTASRTSRPSAVQVASCAHDHSRPEPVDRPRPRLHRAVHGGARRDHHERRPAADPDRSRDERRDLQWIVNAYTLVFGGFLLLGGRAGDLIGRKKVFLAGVVALHARLAALRSRPERDVADRRARPAGPRRCARLAGRALDRDHHLRGGRRADEGDGRLGGDRRRRRRRRPACSAGSSSTRSRGSGSSSSTSRWGSRRSPSRFVLVPESVDEHAHRSFDVLGAVSVTAGLDRARLRHRPLRGARLDVGRGARLPRRLGGAADPRSS